MDKFSYSLIAADNVDLISSKIRCGSERIDSTSNENESSVDLSIIKDNEYYFYQDFPIIKGSGKTNNKNLIGKNID